MPELQAASSLRTSITPTKKIEMGRTIMPDGTIVTTVTTIQSRPKLDCKLGKLSSFQPARLASHQPTCSCGWRAPQMATFSLNDEERAALAWWEPCTRARIPLEPTAPPPSCSWALS